MNNQFSRSELIFGKDAINLLKTKRVAVFGIGGVGGYAAEAIVRSGVGTIDLIDNDTVSISNLNRQIIALNSTIGMLKTDVAENRLKDINEDLVVNKFNTFFLPENANNFDFNNYDYIVDAIDTVTAKLKLIEIAQEKNIPIISSMGTGNKINPTMLEVSDIYKTSVCPLAKVIRRECKKRDIKKLKVVYSKEEPIKNLEKIENPDNKKPIPGSTSFVPGTAGLIIASEVIKDLLK